MTKGIEAVRKFRMWQALFGAIAAALIMLAPARAIAGDTGSTDEYGGIAVINSVLLDPFDPVPTIQFHHGCDGDCRRHCEYDGCGEGPRCHDECHWHGWYCRHECDVEHRLGEGEANMGWWRCAEDCHNGDWWCDHDCHLEAWHCEHDCYIHDPCERDCRNRPYIRHCDRDHDCRPQSGDPCLGVCYGRLVHEYDESLKHYDEQSRWYFEHVMEDHHHDGDHHDIDHHDGDHHDGDHHDGDHHDGDHHDGPPPPVVVMGPDHAGPPGPGGPGPGGPAPGAGGPPPGPGGPSGPVYGPGPSGSGPSSYDPPPH